MVVLIPSGARARKKVVKKHNAVGNVVVQT